MSDKCLCNAKNVVVFPCSGGSNCGQIANEAAVRLTKEGVASLFCLAGIGAHIGGMVESARSAERIVAIDGCSVGCARKVLEHAGLTITDYIDVAKLGVEKNKNFDLVERDVVSIVDFVRKELGNNDKV